MQFRMVWWLVIIFLDCTGTSLHLYKISYTVFYTILQRTYVYIAYTYNIYINTCKNSYVRSVKYNSTKLSVVYSNKKTNLAKSQCVNVECWAYFMCAPVQAHANVAILALSYHNTCVAVATHTYTLTEK